MLKVDLHCHSNISDGVLSPAAVAAHARKAGVDVWALTDHDEVSGVAAARTAALDLGMRFVAGVEISITWAGQTVHIVGLQVDENNPGLVQGLHQTRSGRDARGREIAGMDDRQRRIGAVIAQLQHGSPADRTVGHTLGVELLEHAARHLVPFGIGEFGKAAAVDLAHDHDRVRPCLGHRHAAHIADNARKPARLDHRTNIVENHRA